ncbi:hypothetical protein Bca52824_048070 [Brassica carinata]|uniref:Membrin n=1 Tax=Brassica carinata TaxID=52824 RepID=A0A8X7UST9_BRACI|nr:hypothetical protein Bca52824_048070 [Brassica carinata]
MDSSDLTSSVKRDITEVQSLCASMDGYGAQSPCEEAEYLNKSLEKYTWRNQRKMTEARERESRFVKQRSGEGAHILQIFDDERLLDDSFSSGVAILAKYAEQRDRLNFEALDVLNTVGLSNSVLRLIERHNRVDTCIKYAGMIATIVILYLFIKWTS